MHDYTPPLFPDLVIVKGTGTMADGVALRLFRSGYHVILSASADCGNRPAGERPHFADAALDGAVEVEGVTARLIPWPPSPDLLKAVMTEGAMPVVYPGCADDEWMNELEPACLVDAAMTGKGKSTKRRPGVVTIGLGPGFVAGPDPDELIGADAKDRADVMADAVVETATGPTLGMVILEGEAASRSESPEDDRDILCPARARAVGGGVLEALLMFGIMPEI